MERRERPGRPGRTSVLPSCPAHRAGRTCAAAASGRRRPTRGSPDSTAARRRWPAACPPRTRRAARAGAESQVAQGLDGVPARLVEELRLPHRLHHRELRQQHELGPMPRRCARTGPPTRPRAASGSCGSSQTVTRMVVVTRSAPAPRLEVQPLARAHVERVVPRVEVADRGDAVLLRGVVVRGELGPQRRLAASSLRQLRAKPMKNSRSCCRTYAWSVGLRPSVLR